MRAEADPERSGVHEEISGAQIPAPGWGAAAPTRTMALRAAEQEAQHKRESDTQVRDLQRLHEVTLGVAAVRDSKDALGTILDAALGVAETGMGVFSVISDHREYLQIGASRGFSKAFLEAVRRVPAGCGACGMALERRARVVVQDCLSDPAFERFREAVRIGGFTSSHSVPVITRGGDILGVLTAHFAQAHTPDDREIRLFDLYAQMAADFLERAQAEEKYRIACRDKERVLATITDGFFVFNDGFLCQYVNDAGLTMVGKQRDELIGRRLPDVFPANARNGLLKECQRAVRTGSPAQVETCHHGRWYEHRVSPTGVGLTILVSDITERKRAEESLQKANVRAQLLSEMLAQLLSARDADGIVRELVAKVAAHLGAETYLGYRVTEDGQGLRLHFHAGISEDTVRSISRISFEQTLCGTAALTRQPVISTGIQTSRDEATALAREMGLQSYACNPLIADDRLLGTLAFASRTRPAFDLDELEFIRVISQYTAAAINKANLYAALKRELAQQRQADAINRRLAAIVESTDDAIIAKDLDGNIRSWNKGAERIFGYTADETVGRPITMLVPPEGLAEEADILERLRRGEKIDHIETVRRHKSGGIIHVSLTISPIKDSAGHVIGTSKIARDITERKRAELQQHLLYELVASVNKAESLEDVFEAALSAILLCQNADRASILLCDENRVMRFRAWRGLSEGYRSAVEGHSPWKADDLNPEPVCINNLATVDLPESLRSVIQAERIQALAFIPIQYGRRLLGKFMVYYNEPHSFTTEEVRTAMTMASQLAFAIERKHSSDAMERLVQDRTASLREAVQQMEEFSYTVSHDLRAPLRGMRGFSTALIEDFGDSLPAEALRYATKINENAIRLDRMIMDVLTFSRIARADFQPGKLNLDKLVRDLVAQSPELQSARTEITVAPLHSVLGHEPSLVQAISNLLTNAVKFVEEGSIPRVQLWTEVMGNDVRLYVQDNGIGIDPKVHHRLFNMFERVHPRLGYEGTGVGLAIVRKAAERMGGTVGVESDGVHGTRFWIQLKAAEGA